MVRVKTGPTRRRKHKKILKQAKGYRASRSRRFKTAKEAVLRSLQYAYSHRRQKKREYRRWWIARISAALRPYPISYSRFLSQLKKSGVRLNRPMLAQLAYEEPKAFQKLVELALSSKG
ncbi:MAG: 50S ribosomal protein L20 [bacterium JZ-2024 1]